MDVEHERLGKMQLVEIRRSVGYFMDYLKVAHIDDMRNIRAFHLVAHMNSLPKKRVMDGAGEWGETAWKPKSVKNHFANVGAFMRWAQRMEYIVKLPTLPPMPHVPRTNIKFYTDREQRKVIDAIPVNHQPIFEFMAWCGCRPSEARALRVQDVDLKTGVIIIQSAFDNGGDLSTTKTKRPRPLPIDESVGPVITPAVKNRIAGFVFSNPVTGDYYTEEALRYQWEAGIKKAKVRYLSITEGMRKTVATRLINQGVDTKIISELLGNSPTILTEHYAQIMSSRYSGILAVRTQTVPKGKKINVTN